MVRLFQNRFPDLWIAVRPLEEPAILASDLAPAISGDHGECVIGKNDMLIQVGEEHTLRDRVERKVAQVRRQPELVRDHGALRSLAAGMAPRDATAAACALRMATSARWSGRWQFARWWWSRMVVS